MLAKLQMFCYPGFPGLPNTHNKTLTKAALQTQRLFISNILWHVVNWLLFFSRLLQCLSIWSVATLLQRPSLPSTIQVQTVERMGAERVVFLLLQFQYVLAFLASAHIEQGVWLLVPELQQSTQDEWISSQSALECTTSFFLIVDNDAADRQPWISSHKVMLQKIIGRR